MRKRLLFFAFTLVASAAASLSVPRAEAACRRYCCPDAPSRCVTCCIPRCDLNCP
jgi:hypothetical protein